MGFTFKVSYAHEYAYSKKVSFCSFIDATSKTKTGSSSAQKYEYIKDEEHIMRPSPVDVRQIAQLVAARFTEQHGQEETYGSEDSDSEPELILES